MVILRVGHTSEMTVMDAWNVADGWMGTDGQWHVIDPDTRAALRHAQGADLHPDGPPGPPPQWFVRTGERHALWSSCVIELDDGSTVGPFHELDGTLPLGVHRLVPEDGGPTTTLFVVPPTVAGPGRTWGWSTQLYATRSRSSWGQGDLGDLARLASWSESTGASLLAHNPLGATLPLAHQQPSPYYASSRRFLSPLYLDVPAVRGARSIGADLERAAAAGAALNSTEGIDRDEIWRLKLATLEAVWEQVRGAASTRRDWPEDRPAVQHALFCALAEHHGSGWLDWPHEHRHPDLPAVAAFAEQQLTTASAAGAGLLADLPVGFDPSGSDAWVDQDLLALDCSVGAPPDDLGPLGQDWGLPPYVPWKLKAVGYAPWIDTLRRNFAHCSALRIDHVMGLFRLFWIPPGGEARHGGYVYQGAPDAAGEGVVELLDLAMMEAARAGASLVGEDLGTVEPSVRDAMTRRAAFGYRIAWFEDEPPEHWPANSLAALTTHDLPTAAGLWSGDDERARVAAGMPGDEAAEATLRGRLASLAGIDPAQDPAATPVREVVHRAHEGLAASGSDLVVVTLEDAVGAHRRPNLPGTVDEYPNWRIPLPVPLEELGEAGADDVAAIMRDSGR